ncbi:Putative cytochrome b5-like heme/steroid binding domain-containing protein [Septoria linicola]|uniref:Cytochrome b5-like heme/steroid binding domain-containing protein n=1 Tax=Septoria linicola TaxID=215465 RepID=A0A9Q9B6K7_9PEZI|nr:putative cytochrome b5-like heme/steroid binding domain-containing protein [Septoria linicola]USW59185.1 Putative cytochrome b5-like heme/steroid binding domain-containing protein [Septoria linicola]
MAPADNLRQRKPAQDGIPSKRVPANTPEDYDNSKEKRSQQGPNLEPDFWVVAWLAITFITAIVALFYYKVDNRNHGPFAAYINDKFPLIDRSLNNYGLGKKPAPLFGAAAAETSSLISLTEADLKEFDGTDPDKPIYLGINGTIFDVSASPAFYGPGGHYNHFVGKDATRAWITECWDEPEQFTWRLDDVNVMFMPKYLDEMLQDVGDGNFEGDLGAMGSMPQEMLSTMAAKAIDRFGKVGPKAKAKRRITDKEEADAKVQETLTHWVNFFAQNAKYKTVGHVILDETLPAPPKPCSAAMQKRPLKGGKLESLMGSVGGMFGGSGPAAGGAGLGNAMKGAGAQAGEMPAAVKEQVEKAKKQAEAAKDSAAEGAEAIKQQAGGAAAEGAETVKQKAKDATAAAAEGTETVKEKAKSATAAAAEGAETVKQKAAADTAKQAAKQAADAAADGAEKVKQKAEEIRDEL